MLSCVRGGGWLAPLLSLLLSPTLVAIWIGPTYGLQACLVRGVPSGDRIWDQVRSSTRRTSRLRNVGGVSQSLPSFSANSDVSGRLELAIASS
jgi:hypothetical protein